VHPRDADTSGLSDGRDTVWPRTSPQGLPGVYVTREMPAIVGNSRTGLCPELPGLVDGEASVDDCRMAAIPLGSIFGTTHGELWASRDEGAR